MEDNKQKAPIQGLFQTVDKVRDQYWSYFFINSHFPLYRIAVLRYNNIKG